jgi:hypothetical protein
VWLHIDNTENFRNLSQQDVLILQLQHFEEAFQEEKLGALKISKTNHKGFRHVSIIDVAGYSRRPFSDSDPRRRFIIEDVDPRIHFALVCGSNSCPPIDVYEAGEIHEQLELVTSGFVNSDERPSVYR